jgi:hypothetical protein
MRPCPRMALRWMAGAALAFAAFAALPAPPAALPAFHATLDDTTVS